MKPLNKNAQIFPISSQIGGEEVLAKSQKDEIFVNEKGPKISFKEHLDEEYFVEDRDLFYQKSSGIGNYNPVLSETFNRKSLQPAVKNNHLMFGSDGDKDLDSEMIIALKNSDSHKKTAQVYGKCVKESMAKEDARQIQENRRRESLRQANLAKAFDEDLALNKNAPLSSVFKPNGAKKINPEVGSKEKGGCVVS